MSATQNLANKFYTVLWTTTSERDKRDFLEGGSPAWVKHERDTLLKLVNEERVKRGLSLATEHDVAQGELVGDACYGVKLAEHCARLALGEG